MVLQQLRFFFGFSIFLYEAEWSRILLWGFISSYVTTASQKKKKDD